MTALNSDSDSRFGGGAERYLLSTASRVWPAVFLVCVRPKVVDLGVCCIFTHILKNYLAVLLRIQWGIVLQENRLRKISNAYLAVAATSVLVSPLNRKVWTFIIVNLLVLLECAFLGYPIFILNLNKHSHLTSKEKRKEKRKKANKKDKLPLNTPLQHQQREDKHSLQQHYSGYRISDFRCFDSRFFRNSCRWIHEDCAAIHD